MDNNDNRLTKPIEECSSALIELVNSLTPENDSNYLLNIFDFDSFRGKNEIFENILKNHNFDYNVEIPVVEGEGDDNDAAKLKNEIQNFNEGLSEKTRDFILAIAFQRAAHEFLTKHLEQSKSSLKQDASDTQNDMIEIGTCSISHGELQSFNRLCILVDFQMHLLIGPYPSTKPNFYLLLTQILQVLFAESTDSISTFWYYMETRMTLIQDKVFDKQIISDRISFLEICNGLTDKYFQKNIQGKRDLSKKDTFNDTFQYRVRGFIANIFNFEDNTGLNKYFSTSNRIVNDFTTNSRSRDDNFVKDIIQINKLFRDPYYFLKLANHKQLSRIAETLKRVYEYLIEEEIRLSAAAPKIDQFIVPTPKSEAEEHHLKEKYASKLYFPENYLLAPFDERKRGEAFDSLKKQDYSFMSKQFDDTKVRQTFLFQIYFICHLYYELNAANKKVFLKSLGGPANIKHFTDDSPPDSLVSLFFKIKREIPKRYRSIDSQFSFLLQHMAIDETFWWGWLIYGKDPKTGKPLFTDKVLTATELKVAQEKTETVIPFKEKRYFNTYATPQLSRKMKVERGLLRLDKTNETGENTIGLKDKISELTDKIADAKNKQELNQLIDERNLLTWKLLKRERNTNWLQFGSLLNEQMLSADLKVPEDTEELKPHQESTDQLVDNADATDTIGGSEDRREDQITSESADKLKSIEPSTSKDPEIESNLDINSNSIQNETSATKRGREEDDTTDNDLPATKKSKN